MSDHKCGDNAIINNVHLLGWQYCPWCGDKLKKKVRKVVKGWINVAMKRGHIRDILAGTDLSDSEEDALKYRNPHGDYLGDPHYIEHPYEEEE